jgi:serine protease Do
MRRRLIALLSLLSVMTLVYLKPADAAEPGAAPAAESNGLRLLEEMQAVITELAETAKPSVVSLFPTNPLGKGRDVAPERVPNAPGSGAGVIITPAGHIITNNHVVGDSAEIEVRLSDRSKLIAQVIGKDPDTDLAVLKVTADRPLPYANFGDSSTVRVGQWVLAVGNPFGLERTVTLGVVSGIGRENVNLSRYENFIQTDASINPGNSGGPLFNLRGEIIGINTAIINFAQGRVVRGWLGVGIQPLTPELARKFGVPEQEGVLVNEVFEKDPAAAAGIKAGDVITRIEGSVIDSPNRLSRIVAGLLPGAKAHVEVVRNQERIVVEVALTERRDHATVASLSQSRSESKLGVDVQDLTAALAEKFKLRESHGVLVTKVEPGSLAQSEGLREGDLIKEVNRADVGTVGDFTRAVAKVRRGDTVLLRVLRESRAFYVVLKPNEP